MKGYSAFTKKEEKEYEPQSKTFVGDMIPQTELNKMDLEDLEMERENIFNNAYEDAKADNNTSTIKLLEGRMGKLDELIDKKRQDTQTGNYDEVD